MNTQRLALVPRRAPSPAPTPLSERSDDELMLLARGGLEAAFATLIRRHQAGALRVAARYLADEAVAADVAQNAFIDVFRALPSYQPRARFRAYLHRVILNHCHLAFRARKNQQRASVAVLEQSSETDEAQLLLREQRRDLARALGALSPKLASVVLLRFSAGSSYEEIAETLDIPCGTVKRRLFDAMAELRELLERP
jgi:RNA polymerase sigma-70 factor (ECF subfamily)